jgi:glycosyltransferase involved in cell wall biosynthesis
MRVFHFYTALFVPTHGGLERSVLRIALALSDAETKVIVYVRLGDHDYSTTPAIHGVEVVSLAALRSLWAEPLANSNVPGSRMAAEEARLNFLLLRAEIERRMLREPGSRHALVSFFLSHEGFTAQAVAVALGVPHIATVRGTDFGRGFYAPSEFPIVTSVAAAADLVITTNRTQAAELQRAVPGCRTETIHNSVAENLLASRWRSTQSSTVRLVSDGGFSHRKGTQVLLDAFAVLYAEGFPVTLAIIGDVERKQHTYWSALRASYLSRFGTALTLGDYVDAAEVPAFLLGGDVYCLASLAEGCSQARCGALAVGMPMVSTRCGELPDFAEGVSHVRLAAPADHEGFTGALRLACRDVLNGGIAIDTSRVDEWKRYFAPERERAAWVAAVDRVLT